MAYSPSDPVREKNEPGGSCHHVLMGRLSSPKAVFASMKRKLLRSLHMLHDSGAISLLLGTVQV